MSLEYNIKDLEYQDIEEIHDMSFCEYVTKNFPKVFDICQDMFPVSRIDEDGDDICMILKKIVFEYGFFINDKTINYLKIFYTTLPTSSISTSLGFHRRWIYFTLKYESTYDFLIVNDKDNRRINIIDFFTYEEIEPLVVIFEMIYPNTKIREKLKRHYDLTAK